MSQWGNQEILLHTTIYGAAVIITYLLARHDRIRRWPSAILALSLGAVYLMHITTLDEVATNRYPIHLLIILTGLLLVIYLWNRIITDVDAGDIELSAATS